MGQKFGSPISSALHHQMNAISSVRDLRIDATFAGCIDAMAGHLDAAEQALRHCGPILEEAVPKKPPVRMEMQQRKDRTA